jgi:hypothetical protein
MAGARGAQKFSALIQEWRGAPIAIVDLLTNL